MTLVEVVVVVAMVAMLSAVLLPSMSRARGAADRAGCQNQLRQLGLALLNRLRAPDVNDQPKAFYWTRVSPADGRVEGGWLVDHQPSIVPSLRCPADEGTRPPHSPLGPRVELSYLMNDDHGRFTSLDWSLRQIASPADTLALLEGHETRTPWNDTVAWQSLPADSIRIADLPTERHLGGGNLLFFDSHAEFVPLPRYEQEFPHWPNWNPN